MKPKKCPYALVFNGIKICEMNVFPCERVNEKDCCMSDKHENPFEKIFKEHAEEKKNE